MDARITVITPTYNRADMLRETIESVLNQSFSSFEYYIIDDGSSDDTRETVSEYLRDERVHYVFQENGGEPSAVNHGWHLAKGDYFVQVNSDDPMLPDLFESMCEEMDAQPDAIVGYCDFQFIDENGETISITRSPDWSFPCCLAEFSCYAAAPGTFFRRSALMHWMDLRKGNYRHINDIEMLWDMALEGPFLHVPKVLANWREHSGQISNKRYRAIPEIEDWFRDFFSREGLSEEVKQVETACRNAIDRFEYGLIEAGDMPEKERRQRRFELAKRMASDGRQYVNLQVGDNDLIGNKFNGHDLHLLLREHGMQSFHFVTAKQSNDQLTFCIPTSPTENYARQLLSRREFLVADVVHLHLIHNTNFDINLLPLLAGLKPLVITFHDPFFTSGHCIHSHDCMQWLTGCTDCEHPEWVFALEKNDAAYRYEEKRLAFQNANISIIVASKWMQKRVEHSPIMAGKPVYLLPFGVDQELFRPGDTREAKKALGIDPDTVALMFRADVSAYKGLDVIKNALRKLHYPKKIALIAVAQKGVLEECRSTYDVHEYGWITDDTELVKLYQACDIFLMPSRQEAFGMMAIEAMSCGKPVLALNGTSLPDVIHTPQCGLAVREDAFAATLQEWVLDEAERLMRGEKSLACAKENYSIERYTHGMLDIYDRVMRGFVPSPHATEIVQQLLSFVPIISAETDGKQEQSRADTEPNSTPDCSMSYSRSWRITKPVRAFSNAIHGGAGGVKRYAAYMRQEEEDIRSNEAILNSTCWRITAPLRRIAGFFRKHTPAR